MKNVVMLLLCFLGIFKSQYLLAQESTPEMQVVQKFMENSMLPADQKVFPEEQKIARKALISPTYLKSKKIEDEKYKVNMYVPQGFMVEHNEGPELHVYIWGANGLWKHELFFNVEKEGGAYYIVPLKDAEISKYDFFDPWTRVLKNSQFDKSIMGKK